MSDNNKDIIITIIITIMINNNPNNNDNRLGEGQAAGEGGREREGGVADHESELSQQILGF